MVINAETSHKIANWIIESETQFPWFALPHALGDENESFRHNSALLWPSRSAQYERLLKQKLEHQILLTDQLLEASTSSDSSENSSNIPLTVNTSALQVEKDEIRQQKELEKQYLAEAVNATMAIEFEVPISSKTSISREAYENQEEPITSRTFSNWLKILDDNRDSDLAKPHLTKVARPDIINKFLEEASKPERASTFISIERPKTHFFSPEKMVEESLKENQDFITETLANVYVKQGNIKKAIRAFENLLQKHPEKSTYFAALIKELKKK